MKKHIYLIAVILSVLFYSCTKTATSSDQLNEQVGSSRIPVTSAMAFTSANSYTVTGNVRVYQKDGKLVLALENFKSTNGPDLRVYISKEMQPVNFIELGRLRSVNNSAI